MKSNFILKIFLVLIPITSLILAFTLAILFSQSNNSKDIKQSISSTINFSSITVSPLVSFSSTTIQIQNTLIPITVYKQKYALSCEAAAASSALRALGYQVTEDQFLNNLEYDNTPRTTDSTGKIAWGNPYKAFIGDYKGIFHKTGYGIYAPAISANVKKYGAQSDSYLNMNFENLLTEISKGKLAVVWVPTRFEIQETKYWYTPDGIQIPWIDHEHAMVMYGFDRQKNEILLMDVATGTYMQKSFTEFQRGWSYLGNQAVTVYNSIGQ